jgi:hypothetical protein
MLLSFPFSPRRRRSGRISMLPACLLARRLHSPVFPDADDPASSDDLVLPFISRMLMEEDIDDKFYQFPDHPALLNAQQPYAQILLSDESATNSNSNSNSSFRRDRCQLHPPPTPPHPPNPPGPTTQSSSPSCSAPRPTPTRYWAFYFFSSLCLQ